MKNTKNKKLIILLSAITGLFLLIVLYLLYFELFLSEDLNKNSLNARNSVDETKIKRGTIFDKYGDVLTESILVDGEYVRENKYNYLYSNIIGYNSTQFGKTGIELVYNSDLLNIKRNSDIFDKIESIYKDSTIGANIYLTIDDKLQSYVYDILGDEKGVAIVANPRTGEILSLVSKPSYNINKLSEDWDNIINSNDALLLNRATQGLYEPGSVFKIVSAISFLRSGIDLEYNDMGSAKIAGNTVNNYNNASYGQMDLEKALNVSSNTYFFEKSQDVSNEIFEKTIADFGINKEFDFPILINDSKFPFKNGLSNLEKAYAAFGQGKNYMKPLDLLLVGMGIANDGIVYTPKIVDKIDDNGNIKSIENKILSNSIEKELANTIKDYLTSTAESNNVYLKNGIRIAGKTGSAETVSNLNNLWYLSMAPAENPEYVVLILLEHTDGLASKKAVPKAVNILNYIYSN